MQNSGNYKKRRRFVILKMILLIVFLGVSCNTNYKPVPAQFESKTNAKSNCNSCSILFIGSSYLSYIGIDVIEIFQKFAVNGGKSVIVDRSVRSGMRLYDHITNEETLFKINERNWNYIILQGNAAFISKKKWHENIVPYLEGFRKLIKEKSPRTCVIYMMPWAYSDGLTWIIGETDDYDQMQNNIYNETINLVNEIDIATAPVGWTWYTAITNGYGVDLYLADHNHQTRSGAYLAACVFYSTIFEEQAPPIVYALDEYDNPPYLREVAFNTVMNHLNLWNIY